MRGALGTVLGGLLLLLASGCGTDSSGSAVEWRQGHGELPAQIGNVDVVQPSGGLLLDLPERLLELAGYAEPSGQWFLHNGEGKLGYGFSSGTMKAGEEAAVSVSTPFGEVQVDRNVRIRLTEWGNGVGEAVQLTEQIVHLDSVSQEKKLFSMALPENENTAYLLTAEILGGSGEVEDTMGSRIYVPVPEINAAFKTSQDTYSFSDTEATIILYNAGPTVLRLGTYYTIESKVDHTWRIVPFPGEMVFPDIGISLAPGDDYEQTVDIGGLGKGQYRIVKSFNAEGTDLSADLAAEFIIDR